VDDERESHEPEPVSDVDVDPEADPNWVRPVDKFKRSSLGTVVAAGLLGVRDALEGRPEKEEVTIVSEAPAQPARGNIDLVLDPDHPERSTAVVRRRAPDPEPADEELTTEELQE
jgi:hypothetical protein